MSMNNVVPGYILRDPEKLASFMEAMEYPPAPIVRKEGPVVSKIEQSVVPGMEDWVPEDDTEEAVYTEDVGEEWRLVDVYGREVNFRDPPHISRYKSERSARIAAARFRNQYGRPATPQKGSVTWQK